MAITYDARTGTLTSTGSYSVDVTTGNVTLNTANNIDFEDGGTLIGRWREEDFSVYSNKSTHSASDLADRVDNTWAAGNYTSTFVGGPTWTISGTAGITISDPVTFNTSGTTETSINIPHGAAPSTPTNGDIWTTTAGMFIYVNGGTVGPLSDSTGTVLSTGSPSDNQVAVWTATSDTLEGTSGLTYSGTALDVTGNINVNDANGPSIQNETASATNPTLIPNRSDVTTGLGSSATGVISLVTSGVEARRLEAATVQTTNATQTEIISIAVASGTTFGYRINIVGNEAATGDTVFESIFGAIHNQGGTTAIVGSDIVDRTEDTGAAAWVVTVAADDTTDALTVDVTGEASHTIDWKVSVEILDV